MVEKRNVIVACETFNPGGAETFSLRIARYYKEKGHTVFLVCMLGDSINQQLVEANAGDFEVISLQLIVIYLVYCVVFYFLP